MHAGHRAAHGVEFAGRELRRHLGDELATVGARKQRALRILPGIAQREAQQEAVELRIRQRIRAREIDRVLRGDDEERRGQGAGDAVDGHLVLGHRLQQRALRARRRAVDLVGQQNLREHRAGMELESLARGVEDGHAEDVRRQQVGGELHALELQADGGRQRMRERGLAQARQILDQDVAVGEQRDEGQPHLVRLAQHQRIDLRLCAVKGVAQGLR